MFLPLNEREYLQIYCSKEEFYCDNSFCKINIKVTSNKCVHSCLDRPRSRQSKLLKEGQPPHPLSREGHPPPHLTREGNPPPPLSREGQPPPPLPKKTVAPFQEYKFGFEKEMPPEFLKEGMEERKEEGDRVEGGNEVQKKKKNATSRMEQILQIHTESDRKQDMVKMVLNQLKKCNHGFSIYVNVFCLKLQYIA